MYYILAYAAKYHLIWNELLHLYLPSKLKDKLYRKWKTCIEGIGKEEKNPKNVAIFSQRENKMFLFCFDCFDFGHLASQMTY